MFKTPSETTLARRLEASRRPVAALFVATNGAYFGLAGVDPWDEVRDARLYKGPFAVVAHPPCERWGRYWGGGPMLHGTPRQKTLGDDGGCFASALASVRKYGGILEHPEGSHAWAAHDLVKPTWGGGWVSAGDGVGMTCCVAQGNYGHRTRKLTWLYSVACVLPELDWSIPVMQIKLERLSHRQRAATPDAFRDLLISIARSAPRRCVNRISMKG